MKRIWIILGLLLFITIPNVKAADYIDIFNGLGVSLNCTGEDADIHEIDILILRSELDEEDILTEIRPLFSTQVPNYDNLSHLNDQEWVSYRAFYKGGETTFSDECEYDFDLDLNDNDLFKTIKLVYYSVDGETLYTSDSITLPTSKFYQDAKALLYFDMQTYGVEERILVNTKIEVIIWFISLILVTPALAIARYITAFLFNLCYKKKYHIPLISALVFAVLFTIGWLVLSWLPFLITGIMFALVYITIDAVVLYKLFLYEEGKATAFWYYVVSSIAMFVLFLFIAFFGSM